VPSNIARHTVVANIIIASNPLLDPLRRSRRHGNAGGDPPQAESAVHYGSLPPWGATGLLAEGRLTVRYNSIIGCRILRTRVYTLKK
jgi:hypothetical protein